MSESSWPKAYKPFAATRRPGGPPSSKPKYRVLVHRQYADRWAELGDRVGVQAAQAFWEHASHTPGVLSGVAKTTILKGKPGRPKGPGWSPTYHYEVSGAGRINYQFHNSYKTTPDGDEHAVVFILSIDYSSH